ncbi:1-phosphofructokinase [Anaerolentibacter hominis]|uniref:1-phosphofructokinase n=1 Tax=Anaerolentibacter hominis TaxID=3079009 RepID=UPI0031B83C1F
MIYTVTFNPSLDYNVGVKDFQLGELHRTTFEQMLLGGKGINVSVVLKNLGIDSVMLGFLAGFTGEEIERRAKSYGCGTDFIHLKEGLSRINVKIKTETESEINGQGPDIPEQQVEEMFEKLDKLTVGDTLILSGSIPNTLPSDVYEKILERLSGRGIRFVVDATKDLLCNVLKYKPFLIKPNNHELAEIFHAEIKDKEDVVIYGRKMQEMGAQNVLVSMAGDGAVLISASGNVYKSEAPKGKLVNSVGAGDSMVAGFIAGYEQSGGNEEAAFKMGLSAGSASAFSPNLATQEQVMAIYEKL